jgi:hypothetical protein
MVAAWVIGEGVGGCESARVGGWKMALQCMRLVGRYVEGTLFYFLSGIYTPVILRAARRHVEHDLFGFGAKRETDMGSRAERDAALLRDAPFLHAIISHMYPDESGQDASDIDRGPNKRKRAFDSDAERIEQLVASATVDLIDPSELKGRQLKRRAEEAGFDTSEGGYEVEELRRVVREKNARAADEAGSCSVCLEDFVSPCSITRLKCRHCFHSDCILKWARQSYATLRVISRWSCPTCPVCRERMR